MEKVRPFDREAAVAHAETAGAACMAAVNAMAVADAVYEQRLIDDAASVSSSATNGSSFDPGSRKHRGKHV